MSKVFGTKLFLESSMAFELRITNWIKWYPRVVERDSKRMAFFYESMEKWVYLKTERSVSDIFIGCYCSIQSRPGEIIIHGLKSFAPETMICHKYEDYNTF